MARKPTKPATLDPKAHERLKGLQKALGRQSLGRSVDLTDILSALVLYTPPPQLAGMLLEFWRYNERRAQALEDGQSEPEP